MKCFVIFCLATVAIASAEKHVRDMCPINEEAKDCVSCNESCPSKGRPEDVACSGDCSSGCGCVAGYLRNSKGVCVPKADCEEANIKCTDPNERWRYGNACEENCNSHDCTPLTDWGCFCRAGYRRDTNNRNKCIPESECPASHDCKCNRANYETYSRSSECDSLCKPYAECDKTKRFGCYCMYGQKFDSNGKCVNAPLGQCVA